MAGTDSICSIYTIYTRGARATFYIYTRVRCRKKFSPWCVFVPSTRGFSRCLLSNFSILVVWHNWKTMEGNRNNSVFLSGVYLRNKWFVPIAVTIFNHHFVLIFFRYFCFEALKVAFSGILASKHSMIVLFIYIYILWNIIKHAP